MLRLERQDNLSGAMAKIQRGAKKCSLVWNSRLISAKQNGLPMHSQLALTEHVSLNLAPLILLDPVRYWFDTGLPSTLKLIVWWLKDNELLKVVLSYISILIKRLLQKSHFNFFGEQKVQTYAFPPKICPNYCTAEDYSRFAHVKSIRDQHVCSLNWISSRRR